jgi:hypothetical protein
MAKAAARTSATKDPVMGQLGSTSAALEQHPQLLCSDLVYDVIDGRNMLVWGEVYTREWTSGLPLRFSKGLAEAMVRIRISMLIEYIASLQGK